MPCSIFSRSQIVTLTNYPKRDASKCQKTLLYIEFRPNCHFFRVMSSAYIQVLSVPLAKLAISSSDEKLTWGNVESFMHSPSLHGSPTSPCPIYHASNAQIAHSISSQLEKSGNFRASKRTKGSEVDFLDILHCRPNPRICMQEGLPILHVLLISSLPDYPSG